MSKRKIITRLVLPGLVVWAVLWACNGPSFPLPPPGPDAMQFDQVDQELVSLTIDPNPQIPGTAVITLKNFRTGQFVGGPANADGSWLSPPLGAIQGDLVQLSFRTPEDEGGVICLVVGTFGQHGPEDRRCEE